MTMESILNHGFFSLFNSLELIDLLNQSWAISIGEKNLIFYSNASILTEGLLSIHIIRNVYRRGKVQH
jgi:hypothetical protein